MSNEGQARLLQSIVQGLLHTAVGHPAIGVVQPTDQLCPDGAVLLVGANVWAELQSLAVLDSAHVQGAPN
jgi:hypothetical protein